MVKNLLLPYRFKQIGWGLAITAVLCIPVIMLLDQYLDFPWQWSKHITNGAMVIGLIAMGLIALSQEKIEDEYIAALRGQTITLIVYALFVFALLWAIVTGPLHLPKWLGIVGRENLYWLYSLPMQLMNIWFVFGLYILIFNLRIYWMRICSNPEK